MPATVFEKPTGRRFRTSITDGPLERAKSFGIKDADDADDAEAAFITAFGGVVPAVYSGLPLAEYDFDEEDAEGVFNGRAIYRNPSSGGGGGEIGESRLSFNTSGGTQHISQSIELMAVAGATPEEAGVTLATGSSEPGPGHPIGATADGVEGADIPVAVFEWEITHTFDDADVDDAFVALIEELTGRTNSTTYKGREAGEVLFLGASGEQVNDGPWNITFRFATSKTRSDFMIGDITVIVKNGWELLDVRYRKEERGTGVFKTVVMVPFLVFIHRVFEEGEFDDLNI